ncbi:MAG: glycoside hydrolase family 5 protein [Candidatus Bathyarchaeota archaeon]|nr:glycoside hydrolase family 5 protein [Candidatus Bathyarchaeota archaeon]
MAKNGFGDSTHKIVGSFVVLLLASTLLAMLPLNISQSGRAVALHTEGTKIVDAYGSVVYLRGIGRAGEIQSASGMWSGPEQEIFNWNQKWFSIEDNLPKMQATLKSYRDHWHVNMIRIFVCANWWMQDTIYPRDYQPDANINEPISYRSYIETLVTEAAKYGIYVDFCPYSVVSSYQFSGQFEGEPGGWVEGTGSYEFIRSVTTAVGKTEAQFWREWWTSVVQDLGDYSNVIFEVWNEPGDNKEAFFGYAVDTYQTIRALGNRNLVFMQWQPGIVPGWNSLTWAPELYGQLKAAAGEAPTNLVFTTHPYLHSPSHNLQWATNYTELYEQLTAEEMLPQTQSAECSVPLVFNEIGLLDADYIYNYQVSGEENQSVQSLTLAHREEAYSFWDGLLRSAKELGIGVCAYYWMQDSVSVAYGFAGEALIKNDVWTGTAQTPDYAGQTFISYGAPSTFSVSTEGYSLAYPLMV